MSKKMKMDSKTKLVFALEHIHHLHDLFEDNQFEKYLQDAVYTLEYECERQLKKELEKKHHPESLTNYYDSLSEGK